LSGIVLILTLIILVILLKRKKKISEKKKIHLLPVKKEIENKVITKKEPLSKKHLHEKIKLTPRKKIIPPENFMEQQFVPFTARSQAFEENSLQQKIKPKKRIKKKIPKEYKQEKKELNRLIKNYKKAVKDAKK
jgi:hypothetical protein